LLQVLGGDHTCEWKKSTVLPLNCSVMVPHACEAAPPVEQDPVAGMDEMFRAIGGPLRRVAPQHIRLVAVRRPRPLPRKVSTGVELAGMALSHHGVLTVVICRRSGGDRPEREQQQGQYNEEEPTSHSTLHH
jgi:hypothetical protein